MILLVHITIALLSLAFTTYTMFQPSLAKLRVSYGFVGATLVSGFFLVASSHAQMLQACMSGLLYLGVVSLGLATAHYRLARQTVRHDD